MLEDQPGLDAGDFGPRGELVDDQALQIAGARDGDVVTWTDPAGIADAIRPDTGLVLVETLANPTLAAVDLRAVAHSCGTVPLLVDNTFATPVLQRPLESGARIVLHSATKYLGGHGDVLGGVVACDPGAQRSGALASAGDSVAVMTSVPSSTW